MTPSPKGILFPKPTPRRTEKQRRKRADAAWIRLVRKDVILRDGGCRSCQELGLSPDNAGLPMQMHELVYRSKTRGLPMEQRVNTKNCILICQFCHSALHAKMLSVFIEDSCKGADGKLRFKLWRRDERNPKGVLIMRETKGSI
tara:strand:- start:340 stop:771 length:432 start_codon:yes stop_codon:yes gene_type:complete